MERNYWQIGKWRRIPVAMHWTVLLAFAMMYLLLWDVEDALMASAAYFTLLMAHAFGHVAVLRRQKVGVFSIRLYGVHPEVEHGFTSRAQAIAVAWGGVAAQCALLVPALVLGWYAPDLTEAVPEDVGAVLSALLGPVLLVYTKVNLFLMVAALLPIGPFDGHEAWEALSYLRGRVRRRRLERETAEKRAREARLFPEENLAPEQLEELEASAAQTAADVIREIARKAKDTQKNA